MSDKKLMIQEVQVTQGDLTENAFIHTLRIIPGFDAGYSFEGITNLPTDRKERDRIYASLTKRLNEERAADDEDAVRKLLPAVPEIDMRDLHEEILAELSRCDFENLNVPFDRHAITDRIMKWISIYFDATEVDY